MTDCDGLEYTVEESTATVRYVGCEKQLLQIVRKCTGQTHDVRYISADAESEIKDAQ